MTIDLLEQGMYTPSADEWLASPGAREHWHEFAQTLAMHFGEPPAGASCPEALFVMPGPLGDEVFVVRASDSAGRLRFHLLGIDGTVYRNGCPDPFAWAEEYPVDWQANRDLPELPPPTFVPERRTTAALDAVLRDGDGPLLLSATQVLVDGGRLMLNRPKPAPKTVREVWSLLPYSTQAEVRVCTFAFSGDLGCELMVTPDTPPPPGHLSEEQVLNYPDSRYERNLQIAIESGDDRELSRLLARRSSTQTLKLAITLVVAVAVISLVMRILQGPPAG